MIKANQDLRNEMKKNNIFQWQVAKELGIIDTNFSRELREELSPERKGEIMKAIKNIKISEKYN